MAITTDEIVWGETYDISVSAQDTGGNPITLDGTWSAACRITEDHIGGDIVSDATHALNNHHNHIVAGGSTHFVPVFSDGTNWRIG